MYLKNSYCFCFYSLFILSEFVQTLHLLMLHWSKRTLFNMVSIQCAFAVFPHRKRNACKRDNKPFLAKWILKTLYRFDNQYQHQIAEEGYYHGTTLSLNRRKHRTCDVPKPIQEYHPVPSQALPTDINCQGRATEVSSHENSGLLLRFHYQTI